MAAATAATAGVGRAGSRPRSSPSAASSRSSSPTWSGFTTLAEQRDAEEVRDLLSRYFDLARGIVERHGGTIEKFIGDAVMAVWGTPTSHEDDAERAVRAALQLVGAVRELGPSVQARAGVLTGEAAVTIGAVGEGMVAGDMVNTASRLQAAAPPGVVLVGEATMNAASRAIAFEAAGEQLLKGKAAPVPAWRALRVVAERGGRGRSEALEAPFVGRDDELRLLEDLYHATARDRRVRLVSVTGQGGIGKSRLAWEFLKYIDGLVETVYWHQGRSPSYGSGITFWALGEMVRERAGLAEVDDEATTRARIAETVARWVPDERERRWIEAVAPGPPRRGRSAVRRAGPALLGLADLLRADRRRRARRRWSSRTSSGPTAGSWRSSTTWSNGAAASRSTSWRWPARSSSRRDPTGAPASATSRASRSSRSRPWRCARSSPASCPGFPTTPPDASWRGPTASPSTPSRSSGCSWPRAPSRRRTASTGRSATWRTWPSRTPCTRSSRRASTRWTRPTARCSRPRPCWATRSRWTASRRSRRSTPRTWSGGSSPSPGASSSIRDLDPRSTERGQFAFVQSLVREVAYSTLARRDRKARHLAAARHFETLVDQELAGALATHYLAAYRNATDGPEADALAGQARIALRAAGDRAVALGAQEQALDFFRDALEVTTEPVERAVAP